MLLAPRSTEYFFKPNPVSFTDIAGHWAEGDILFAAEREIFRGVGGGRFDPNGTMTRDVRHCALAHHRLPGGGQRGV